MSPENVVRSLNGRSKHEAVEQVVVEEESDDADDTDDITYGLGAADQ